MKRTKEKTRRWLAVRKRVDVFIKKGTTKVVKRSQGEGSIWSLVRYVAEGEETCGS